MTSVDAFTRDHLAAHYLSRARGELTTSLAFGHIISDLNGQSGCMDLVRAAQSARADELRHVELCLDLARRFSDEPLPELAPRGTKPVTLVGASEQDMQVLRTVLGCCFGETIAVQWLSDARPLCQDEKARLENRVHLADEVKHSRLGWSYLGSLSPKQKSLVAAYVPVMTALSLRLWTEPEALTPEGLETFGCPSDKATEASVRRALDEVILPGLQVCGCL